MYKYANVNQFNYFFKRNYKQRITVKCDTTNCLFYIFVSGGKNMEVLSLKDFSEQHKHNLGEQCQMDV